MFYRSRRVVSRHGQIREISEQELPSVGPSRWKSEAGGDCGYRLAGMMVSAEYRLAGMMVSATQYFASIYILSLRISFYNLYFAVFFNCTAIW